MESKVNTKPVPGQLLQSPSLPPAHDAPVHLLSRHALPAPWARVLLYPPTLRPVLLPCTCFDADVRASDLASGVLRGAEVVIVVDKAIEGGGGEGIELQRAVGVDVPDVRHVVDVVPRGQVPSESRAGGARGWAGHHHPHRAGEGDLLQGVIHKVEAAADIFRAGCGRRQGRDG